MPLKTKIVLSPKELALVKNEDWILTKKLIIEKVFENLSEGINSIDQNLQPYFAKSVSYKSGLPKISRGENYLGLPYVTLDHPRIFEKEDIFAVRTMFWWANFFSITLHIAGMYKHILAPHLIREFKNIPAPFYLCIHEEQWHHHFNTDNYVRIGDIPALQIAEIINGKNFIKLALKFDLDCINNIQEHLDAGYKMIGEVLATQAME